MEFTTIKPKDHLYHKYPNQTSPQSTFIELNPVDKILSADWAAQDGLSQAEFDGKLISWRLPSAYLTADAISDIMDKVKTLCEDICRGYYEEYNGSRYVGRLDDEANRAKWEIERLLDCMDHYEDDEILVVSAADWFEGVQDEILTKMKNGENPEDLLNDYIESENTGHRQLIVEGVDEYIDWLVELLKDGEDE